MSDITDRGYIDPAVSAQLARAHQRIKALESENARLRRDLMDPPADIQELVIKKLNLVSAEALTQYRVALERCVEALQQLDCEPHSTVANSIIAEGLRLATPLIEKGRK